MQIKKFFHACTVQCVSFRILIALGIVLAVHFVTPSVIARAACRRRTMRTNISGIVSRFFLPGIVPLDPVGASIVVR